MLGRISEMTGPPSTRINASAFGLGQWMVSINEQLDDWWHSSLPQIDRLDLNPSPPQPFLQPGKVLWFARRQDSTASAAPNLWRGDDCLAKMCSELWVIVTNEFRAKHESP